MQLYAFLRFALIRLTFFYSLYNKNMLETLICISEFGTKLVAGLSGLIFAIIIVVCVYFGKNKKSKPSYPDAKIDKQDQSADDGKKKKSKNPKPKTQLPKTATMQTLKRTPKQKLQKRQHPTIKKINKYKSDRWVAFS